MSLSTKLTAVDSYVVFDTETTGKYCDDYITEIGAIKVIDGNVIDRFEMLLNPGKPIPEKIVELTGISNGMVADAPPSKEGVRLFLEFAENLPLVGHNITFDARMLHVDNLPNTLIDTMRIARRVGIDVENHRLRTLYNYCCAKGYASQLNGRTHRAGYDAEMTRVVFETLKPDLIEWETCEYHKQTKNMSASKPRLSKTTHRKAKILAQVRALVDDGVASFEKVSELYNIIAFDDELYDDPVFESLLSIIWSAIDDDVITVDEKMEILKECRKIADPVIRNTELPIKIAGGRFVLTGEFEHGDDAEIVSRIVKAGGEAHKNAPCTKDSYVVVGNLGSKRWAFGDYGTKVDKAVAMQSKGCEILIISEDVLFATLDEMC